MNVMDLLETSRIATGVAGTSKKRALEALSELLSEGLDTLPATQVFSKLIARERLGSTGLGHGVAIPHARVEDLQEARGALIHLSDPVDFEALDQQPVDLLFALLVPEHFTDEHLQILASLADMFSDQALCQSLRDAADADALAAILADWAGKQDERERRSAAE